MRLPAGVTRNTYNASTFKPYDPGAAIGDTAPTAPEPPKNGKNNCGVLGAILLVVVAVAVTVITKRLDLGAKIFAKAIAAGSATAKAAATVVTATTAAAAGSIASQAVGVATGIQDKFRWKQVGLAVITAGVGGGGGSSFIEGLKQGLKANLITQGIAIATGLQERFSWAGLAAAGVGGGVGAEIGDSFGTDFGGQIAKSSAVAIANAATRSAIEGSSFGDNIIAAIPDVIGQAVGGKLGEALLNTFNPPTANPKVIQVASNNPEQVFGAVARVDENGNIVDEVVTTGQKRGFFGRVFNDGVKVGAASAGLGLGFFKGVGESAFGLVKDIGTLILNPIDTGKAVISGVGSGISYIGDVATGEANLKANISGLVSRGGGAIDNYITDRISTVQAAIDGDIGDAFGAGFKIGDDIGTAGFNVVATVGTGGAGFVAVKTGAKVVAKAVRETDFADAARRFTADESGAVPIPFNTGKKLFPNQLPGNLKAELALASRLGVNAISPKGPEFARIANNGTLKFAILENGKLKVIPHTVDGNEISHAVLSKGAPVRAAGEVDIAVAGNKAFGIDIRPHSGHFNFGNNNATNALILNRGRAAFQEFGIKFDGK